MNTIKINREALLEPLYAVSGIIERRHTLPILSNVLLERKGTDITIVATDIEIQISARTVCDNSGEAKSITVGASTARTVGSDAGIAGKKIAGKSS
jgi:DNA polymerase III subunit beta